MAMSMKQKALFLLTFSTSYFSFSLSNKEGDNYDVSYRHSLGHRLVLSLLDRNLRKTSKRTAVDIFPLCC